MNELFEDFKFIKSNKKINYANVSCTLDIETSSFYEGDEKKACMYCFVFGINGKCVIGRTYDDLLYCFNKLVEHYDLNKENRFIFYVHNLGYDFQFFRKWFEWEKIFAISERTPLYALTTNGIEFRCSYQLSGYRLEKVAEHLQKYPVKKLVGYLDYNKVRHSQTPMTEKEMEYQLNDGLVVMAYIQEEIESYHNNITYIPLTKTGKVRKYCRKYCLYGNEKHRSFKSVSRWKDYQNLMKSIPIASVEEYRQLKRAFCGGFTHANALYTKHIVKNAHSMDFTSSYPYTMIAEKFPMSKGELITIKSKKELEDNMKIYCCIFDIKFYDLESTTHVEHPLSNSKCQCVNPELDNGRIVSAKECITTITNVDYSYIKKFYKWSKMQIKNFRRYVKGYLPKSLVESILELYVKKTTLKGVEGQETEYMNSKENINSVYGMSVTDICREEITYKNDEWGKESPDIEKDLNKYNNQRNRFLCYQWGVFVTSFARRNLFIGIWNLQDDYIYSDTDSVKFRNYEKHMSFFESYNKNVEKKLRDAMNFHGLPFDMVKPKTKEGKEKMLGVWDYEGSFDFKTLGAKRYMVKLHDELIKYQWNGKEIKLPYSFTVSGVAKSKAIPYMYNKYKEKIFDAFDEDLIIPKEHTGKQIHTYIDDEIEGEVVDYLGNKGHYHELSCIHLEGSTYELSLSISYLHYLATLKEIQE